MSSKEERIKELIDQLKELRLRESRVMARLEAEITTAERTVTTPRAFEVGDRVYIKNKIRRPVSARPDWNIYKERRATVNKVKPGEIHFTTDNGTNTWRGPFNIRLLRDDD